MPGVRRHAITILVILVPFLAGEAAPAAVDPHLADYVQRVGDRVTRHQAATGDLARTFRVREAEAVAAGPAGPGVIEVTTGLLAALRNEAQLANVLAYEQARAAPGQERRPAPRHGIGRRVARAAAAGAAAGAAGAAAHEVFEDKGRIVRTAATGGASAAAASAVYAAWPRRQGRGGVRSDDRAAQAGLRAAVAAGYDGRAAVEVWGRIAAATPLGGPEGGYGDPEADRKRRKAQLKVLRGARTGTDGEVGRQPYQDAVLGRLDS